MPPSATTRAGSSGHLLHSRAPPDRTPGHPCGRTYPPSLRSRPFLRPQAGEEDVEQAHGARLVQRVVAVAAFRRLDARGAAVLALAGRDRRAGRVQPVLDPAEAPLGEAGASRVAVV